MFVVVVVLFCLNYSDLAPHYGAVIVVVFSDFFFLDALLFKGFESLNTCRRFSLKKHKVAYNSFVSVFSEEGTETVFA